MMTRTTTVDSEQLRAVAVWNGRPKVDLHLFAKIDLKKPIATDELNPASARARAVLLARLPEALRQNADELLQQLAAHVAAERLRLRKSESPATIVGDVAELGPGDGGFSNVELDDFFAHMPSHSYIFRPSGELWPAASVNGRVPSVPTGRDGATIRASRWLDRHRAVEQLTWAPGEPELIEGRLIDASGGWVSRSGSRVFNLYRPAVCDLGDAAEAQRWVDHIYAVYPDEYLRIIQWFAHRVQFPGVKVNHALVLGGAQGIGKDTILEPVAYAIGSWNLREVSPTALLGRFNPFLKSVILRVSEARDLGDVDRYSLYDHMKILTAAPPDVLRIDEKNRGEYAVPNVVGVVVTTNHKGDGLYLPPDDRRHYVAWSPRSKDDFEKGYFDTLWAWYRSGGSRHVAAYLRSLDLTTFDAKAPPPKTAAFYDIVDANRAPEDAELQDVLDALSSPNAVTLGILAAEARAIGAYQFATWLTDRRNGRQIPHRMEAAGYVPVRSETAKDGRWKIGGRRQAVYARAELAVRDRITSAQRLGGVDR